MVILGSFFVMNLILGVLSGEFSKVMIVFSYPATDATASLAPTPVSNSVLSLSLTVSDFHSDSVSGWFCLPETKYVRTKRLRTKCLPDEISSGRNIFRTKYLPNEISSGRNVFRTKRPSGRNVC